jgi:hypothetical protein
MHLLFLGQMKNNCFQIQEWAAMHNQYSAMRRELEQRTMVLEQLHLGWCSQFIESAPRVAMTTSSSTATRKRLLRKLEPWLAQKGNFKHNYLNNGPIKNDPSPYSIDRLVDD